MITMLVNFEDILTLNILWIFEDDMSTELLTFGVGLFLTILIFSLDQYNKQIYKKTIKKSIKKSMEEINGIFKQSSAISTNYDENGESSYENLRIFLIKNLRRMDNYSFVVIHNSSLIKLSKEEKTKSIEC